MKKILTLTFITAVSFNCLAQTKKIVLENKQQLKFVTALKGATSIDAITQTMDITTNANSSKNILVTDVAKDKYQIDLTTTKLKMDFSIMGEKKKFDSEDKSDTTGELSELSKNINVPKKIILFKNGMSLSKDSAKNVETTWNETNPLTGLLGKAMSEGANDPAIAESFFMLIPEGKKLGDSWDDSTISKDLKIHNKYTWDSTKADIATIKVAGKINNKINTDIADMGITMDAEINSTINEIRRVDLKTGIVIFKNTSAVIDGSADMMGVSLPITGTTEATTTFETE